MQSNTSKIGLAVIVTAILVGGVVYYWQTQNATKNTEVKELSAIPQQPTTPIVPKTCVDEPGGTPVITSLSVSSGSTEANFEIKGCNFVSLDGVFNPWIENSQGVKGRLVVDKGTAKLLDVKLRSPLCEGEWVIKGGSGCNNSFILTPGAYKVGVTYVGNKVSDSYSTKKSNEASFTIIPTSGTKETVTQPAPTADWQTYKNEQYGFEVKYPKDASVSSPWSEGIVYIGTTKTGSNVYNYGIGFDSLGSANNKSAENWYSQYYQDKKQEAAKADGPFFMRDDGQNVQLNGYAAYKTEDFGVDHGVVNYYIVHNGNIILLTYDDEGANNPKWNEHEKIIEQMLSTFKFTK